MVHMRPDWVSSNVESSAEGKLFEQFKNYNAGEEIYVLHSLGMGEHITNIFGEIDFVIICNRGVLCVEVKGGAISRDSKNWHFTNRYGKRDSRRKGPFEQVQGNTQSLRKIINLRFGYGNPLHNIQYANCVLMPDCVFENMGPDIVRDVLFDASFTWDLGMMIDISFNYWQNQMDEKHDYHGKSLTDEDCKNLADALRGDFNFVPPLSARYEQIKEKMCRLTDEQYQVLEDHAENDHQLIRGSAGTGKTLLAVEQCRRETLEGKKVLYVCYNQYIAQSVRECVQANGPQFDVFTLHALMMHLSGEKGTGYLSSDYFDKLLPRFLTVDVRDKYDTVILDEGQDLFKEKYMKCIDRVIKGGIRDGRWAFYYDRNQNVYGENEEMDSVLDSFSAFSPAKHTLSVNCRNTMQICDLNRALTGIEQAKRLKIDGKEVTLREYRSLDDEMEQLISDLEDLKEKGIDNSSIVILSPWKKNDPGCCLSRGMIPGRLGKLKTDKPWSAGKNEYRFCTVNTFKGLEADVIMLLDTDSYFDEKRRMQNYVAISRAKVDLYIYCSEDSKAERTKMMLQNMKARQ